MALSGREVHSTWSIRYTMKLLIKSTQINLVLLTLAVNCIPAAASLSGDRKAQAKNSVQSGINYLHRVQEIDGSWSHYPATTALAVSALLRNEQKEASDRSVAKGIQYILRSVKPNGAIYSDANPATALPNYNTSLCLMAILLTHNPAYKSTIRNAQRYLEGSQFDEANGTSTSDPKYGGIGYGSKPDRPDLSNLQNALESLKESGLPKDAPVFQKAIIFLQRVQNRKESNDQAWVQDDTDDGGFIYDSKGRSNVPGAKPASYGSMTYAGIKSYIYCGVSKDDPRVQAAMNWIRRSYSVNEHPGMGDTALYYYYHTMAKTLKVYGSNVVVDTAGHSHDWSQDLAAQLVRTQHPDGSWFNSNARYWEDQPALVTSYTLISLSYCLK